MDKACFKHLYKTSFIHPQMNILKPTLFCICLSLYAISYAQQPKLKTTNVNTDIDLVMVYERYCAAGYGTPLIYKTLANGHYFKDNYVAAKKWYEKLFETENPILEVHLQRYKQTLKALKIELKGNPYLAFITTH